MKFIFQFIQLRILYNFFLFLAVINIFFSTENTHAKTFSVNDIEISTPFEINFNKNEIIDAGFVEAFNELMLSILQTKDQTKLKKTSITRIKSMIETFSIKEEKFIDGIYYLKLNVSFNKKNIFDLLESKNIFPSLPLKKNFLFIPVYIDENKNQVSMFSESNFFNSWNLQKKKYNLLNYILPTEDIEDYSLIKSNIKNLENYDFKEIIDKYNITDHIIMIVYKNNEEIRVFTRINSDKKKKLKNLIFKKIKLNNKDELNKLIDKLKIIYEDYWKSLNQINTTLKLSLTVSVGNNNNLKINQFENLLSEMDQIYSFYVYKFNNKSNMYKIIFNGTPDTFLEIMKRKNYDFETKNKIWILK